MQHNQESQDQIQKQTQISVQFLKKYKQYTNQQLLLEVQALKDQNKSLKSKLSWFEPQKQRILKLPSATKVELMLNDYEYRKIALKICYIGLSYDGMAIQIDTPNTIEGYLFNVLYSLCLTPEPMPAATYTRAGRTDKGVSAMGNVVSLKLRTSIKKGQSGPNTLNYCEMINRLLPEDIRVLATEQVCQQFNSRYWCTKRCYKYFFAQNNLNIGLMKEAIKLFIGKHNFINYCKMNLSNAINFQREILDAEIYQATNNELFDNSDKRNTIYYFYFVGKSFLWHQIRFMVTILFLVGSGQQHPSIVTHLLDLQKFPRKPNYAIAPQYPLILQDCLYEEVKFVANQQVTYNFYNTFNEMVIKKCIEKTLLINCMMMASQRLYDSCKITHNEFTEIVVNNSGRLLTSKKKPLAIHKPSSRGIEEAVKSLKGKKLALYQKKVQKQAQYNRNKQEKLNNQDSNSEQ